MKRVFHSLLVFSLVLLCLLPIMSTDAAASATGKCGDTITWTYDNGTLTLTGSGVMYDYDTVNKAPWSSFAGQITAMKADAAITEIGNMAFYGCTGLQTAELPGVVTVGELAFGDCVKLKGISLPEATTVSVGAFSNCYELASASIPKLIALQKDVFKNCLKLASADFPAVEAVERYAFLNCSGLTSLSLPAVTVIPEHCFELLTGLKSVNMPNVTIMGSYAFNACESLASISLPKLAKLTPHAFRSCESLVEVNLPLVTEIPNSCFYQCNSLKTLNLSTVTAIGDYAFQECYALPTIDFPAVTYVGNCAFYLCTSATEAYLPALTTIDTNGFNSCRSLQFMQLSTALQTVNTRAFEDCKSLKNLYVSGNHTDWHPTVGGYNNDYFLQATVVFDAPPFSIAPLPGTLSAVKGSMAELTVSVQGSSCSYQWQLCRPGTDSWENISGGNAAKLVYGPVAAEDEGLKLRCVVTDRRNATLTSEVVVLKLTPFSDVSATAYYFNSVQWAVGKGVTGGTTATTFSPDAPCTRAQAVTFLWRNAGCPEPASTAMPFTDVPAGSYYYKAVQWAIEQGITAGTTATTFSPNATCTRAQIVTFLWRAAGTPEPASASTPFTDTPAGSYYCTAVQWAVEQGITTGTTATTFAPGNSCTRAQIVTFLYRAQT